MAKSENDSKFKEALYDAMLSFRCDQDLDIQSFIREKAIEFQERRWCSVYMLFDEAMLESGVLKIEAYFTLSHKSMYADPSTISKSKIQKYAGFKTSQTLDFVLIGQLGKWVVAQEDGSYLRSQINSKTILDNAFSIITSASELIPCKYALIECSDDPKIKNVYERYGFSFFQKDGEHNQYTKIISC